MPSIGSIASTFTQRRKFPGKRDSHLRGNKGFWLIADG